MDDPKAGDVYKSDAGGFFTVLKADTKRVHVIFSSGVNRKLPRMVFDFNVTRGLYEKVED